jgi:hypothetical protein
MYGTCPFCNENSATKTNSHIISNFLTTTLKVIGNVSKVYKINKFLESGKYQFSQDSSKENYIFCPDCESLFNTRYEAYIANTFYKDHQQKHNHFDVYLRSKKLAYRVYTNCDYIIFKKFLLLQLYRVHVSNLPEYKSIILSEAQLANVHKNLFDTSYFKDIKITVFATDLIADKTMNVLCATPINKESYFIWMNEFICLYEFDTSTSLIPETTDGANYMDNSPKVIFLNLSTWINFMNILIQILARQH